MNLIPVGGTIFNTDGSVSEGKARAGAFEFTSGGTVSLDSYITAF